jgi:hypothetical protein
MMIRILFLLLGLCALQSCSPKFDTPEAKRNTAFFLRDTTEMHGELLAVMQDSIVVLRSDLGEIDSLRTIKSLYYKDVEFVVFRNDASAVVNGIGGTLAGTFLGALGGLGLGSIADKGGHGGGWGGIIGFFYGGILGGIIGLVQGVSSGTNEVVAIEQVQDLERLQPFVRFNDAIELRRFRRY